MRRGVSPFRRAGGVLTPDGSTGRPGFSAVGLGPVGRRVPGRGGAWADPPDDELGDEFGGSDAVSLEDWGTVPVRRDTAGDVAARIRAGRQFDEWAFSAWWAKARNDVEAVKSESCTRFFRKPFAGALVERTTWREAGPGDERGPWWEEPVVVRAFADAGELAREDEQGRRTSTEVRVGTGLPKLVAAVRDLLRQGSHLEPADEQVIRTYFILTMRDVVLARREPSEWQPVATVELDRRYPAVLQKVTWLLAEADERSS